jgi:HAD superfamily phosphatase (TIGR01668 family)
MAWSQLLQPNLVIQGSIFEITPELLQQHGLEGLILDVDETLVPSHVPQVSSELKQWVEQLKPHARLWLVTNNLNPVRIRRIAEALEVPYLLGAAKPSRRKLRQAAEAMNLPFERLAMVGDRLFTDVLAGNRLGMFTILVDPIVPPNPWGRSSWVRPIELWVSRQLGAKSPEIDARN